MYFYSPRFRPPEAVEIAATATTIVIVYKYVVLNYEIPEANTFLALATFHLKAACFQFVK